MRCSLWNVILRCILQIIDQKTSNTVINFKTLTLMLTALVCQSIAATAQSEISKNNNAFALEFFSQWSRRTDKNIVVSPFSMSAALGMTYPGARAATAHQMKTVLHFHKSPELQNSQFSKLMASINEPGSPMAVSNTIWMQRGFSIEKDFLEVNSKYFDSNFRQVDFAGAADSSRVAINTTIEDQTQDKIKNLLPPGSINSLTRLVLTNAIYFKDSWVTAFDPGKTKDRDFFASPGKPVTTKFMELRDVNFSFFEDDRVTILELPYNNDRFSMLILLPKGDLEGFEKSLTATAYNSWNFAQGRFRTIQLPKFKIDHEVQPVDILKDFGMTDAFQEGKANFTGISKEAKLFISGIFHKAFIEVNEEGTEAAAATAVVVQAESISENPKELNFIANRPFLFILRDRTTNSILFIGRVNDPSQ
jgi:serpin B